MPDNSKIYYVWIADNYNELKSSIDKESIKSYGCNIDMDIFHDTIIKVVDTIKNSELSVKQVLNYVFISYKRNYIRDKKYARNRNVRLDDNAHECVYEQNDLLDYNILSSYITVEFGEELCKLYLEYVDGIPIKELEKKHKRKGLYYQFKKIKKYMTAIIKNPQSS